MIYLGTTLGYTERHKPAYLGRCERIAIFGREDGGISLLFESGGNGAVQAATPGIPAWKHMDAGPGIPACIYAKGTRPGISESYRQTVDPWRVYGLVAFPSPPPEWVRRVCHEEGRPLVHSVVPG